MARRDALLEGEKLAVKVLPRQPATVSPWNNGDGERGDESGRADSGGVEAAARAISHISYAGGCFAWPRQYYYHIFHIMRPRVCLLFHVTPSARTTPAVTAPRQTVDRTGLEAACLNVLPFIARAGSVRGAAATRTSPMKSLYAADLRRGGGVFLRSDPGYSRRRSLLLEELEPRTPRMFRVVRDKRRKLVFYETSKHSEGKVNSFIRDS